MAWSCCVDSGGGGQVVPADVDVRVGAAVFLPERHVVGALVAGCVVVEREDDVRRASVVERRAGRERAHGRADGVVLGRPVDVLEVGCAVVGDVGLRHAGKSRTGHDQQRDDEQREQAEGHDGGPQPRRLVDGTVHTFSSCWRATGARYRRAGAGWSGTNPPRALPAAKRMARPAAGLNGAARYPLRGQDDTPPRRDAAPAPSTTLTTPLCAGRRTQTNVLERRGASRPILGVKRREWRRGHEERAMDADHQTYSRYQILCAECEAWLHGETADDDTFYYDGISFWRSESDGRKRLVPSWRTPSHGWRHKDGCSCDLCATRRPVGRPLSVA